MISRNILDAITRVRDEFSEPSLLCSEDEAVSFAQQATSVYNGNESERSLFELSLAAQVYGYSTEDVEDYLEQTKVKQDSIDSDNVLPLLLGMHGWKTYDYVVGY